MSILPYICYRLVPLPTSASRYYQIQKLQRWMYSAIITVRKTEGVTKLDAIKERNGIVAGWIMQCPWHQKIAEQTINYDAHIKRAAWRGSWAGLAALHGNEQIEAAWASTRRLKTFYQGHAPLRWDEAIKEAQVHKLDPWIVLERTSSRHRGYFDLQSAQSRHLSRCNEPECCCCAWRTTADDQLQRTANGHWACSVHWHAAGGRLVCPHMAEWCTQYE